MKLPIKLPQGLTRTFGKLWLKTRNASPEIFVVSGIICGGAAVVMTAVQTWKGKEKLAKDIDIIKINTKKGAEHYAEEHPEQPQMLEEDRKQYLVKRTGVLAKDIFKIYWLPVTLGLSSVGLVWGGRTILRKELSALAAAYATLSESYNRYRQRVIEEFGADKDQEFQYGYKMVDAVDAETGEVTKRPMIDKEANLSEYGFWFDEGDWDKDSQTWTWKNYKFDRSKLTNRMRVITAQNNFTHDLNTIGYVTLEDVALYFGVDPATAHKWHDYGWVWQEGRRNVIELGVLEGPYQLEVNKAFTDDRMSQNICLINPNVDGYIGFVHEDYKKYDFRYGSAELKKKGIRLRMMQLLKQKDAEDMVDRMQAVKAANARS